MVVAQRQPPLSFAVRDLLALSGPAPNLSLSVGCPIHLVPVAPHLKRLYLYQHPARDDTFFEIVPTQDNSFSIVQRAQETQEDFLIIGCPMAFGAVTIETGDNVFINMQTDAQTLKVKAGRNSRIHLTDINLISAELVTGEQSRIALRCAAEDITTRMDRVCVVTANDYPITRLDSKFGNKSSILTTSVKTLTVTAIADADVTAHPCNCSHVVACASSGSAIIVEAIGDINHFNPKLMGNGTIICLADTINILDPCQMKPKEGGSIIIYTNQQPQHELHNGCRSPRANVVRIISPKP